jgi:NDP-sugar pyrophosphorylase family protein
MKAMILAAGMGTRLLPLTRDIPKALIPLNGVPLLELQIERLKRFGFNELVINIHHHGQQIIDFLRDLHMTDVMIHISDEQDKLLDTGGAVKKAMSLLGDDEPVLIHNVDVITSLDLAAFMNHHRQTEALATLCVQQRHSSRYFIFRPDDRLCGWTNHSTGETKWVASTERTCHQKAFSGIHVIGPHFFSNVEQHRCFPDHTEAFSIVDVYLCLAATGKVMGFEHSQDLWMDLGSRERLKAAEDRLKQTKNYI